MIILLSPDAGPSDRDAVRAAVERLGATVGEVELGSRQALLVEDAGGRLTVGALSRLPHVQRVVPLDSGTPLAAGSLTRERRPVALGPALFGGGHVSVIAGPCTIEDPEHLRVITHAVRDAGAAALRGGAFKVRTSPHAYQGGGLEALTHLRAASRDVGLPFFTELTDPRQVEQVADLVDGVQIGARHMQNFPLLLEAAKLGKPILLKRHMAADLEEFLLAAEYVLQAGHEDVILCERGIKSAERHVRYMLDIGAIPWLKQRVGLPIIVDPSHAAGHHELVPGLARAAIAAGADGLIVEVHHAPEATRCDALQALSPGAFAELMNDVRSLVALDGRRVVPAPLHALDGEGNGVARVRLAGAPGRIDGQHTAASSRRSV